MLLRKICRQGIAVFVCEGRRKFPEEGKWAVVFGTDFTSQLYRIIGTGLLGVPGKIHARLNSCIGSKDGEDASAKVRAGKGIFFHYQRG